MCCWQAFAWCVTRWSALSLSMQTAECRSINHITAEGDALETAGQLHSPHGAEPFACCFGPPPSAGQCACGHRLAADPCPAHTSNSASEQRWKLLSPPVNKRRGNGLKWDKCQSAAVSNWAGSVCPCARCTRRLIKCCACRLTAKSVSVLFATLLPMLPFMQQFGRNSDSCIIP